jgi:methyltransferase (TIGR00027 family)
MSQSSQPNPDQAPDRAENYGQFVPFTARMMAAMRARESERPDRLFEDVWAARLAGPEAFARVDAQLTPQDQAYVAVRTKFFDDFFRQHPLPQVVLLAAGLDTRAYRLPWPAQTSLYELDQPEVMAYKTTLLQEAVAPCQHHLLAADLTQPWAERLLAAGYRPEQPSIWLMEGLLMYLTAAQVGELLATVSQLATVGSWLGLDVVNVSSLTYEPYRGYFQFGCDHPTELLAPYGWQARVSQPGEPAVNCGRYPWLDPVTPEPDTIQRVFFIQAQKTSPKN